MPEISVLMPVYNRELYLKDAIDSILAQTYKNFEFIILNDGSTDRTHQIICSYHDPRINYVHGRRNRGISYRMNQGIGLARGKYIACMHADDISLPHRLEKQITYLESHPEITVLGSNAVIIDSAGNQVRITKRPEFHELIHWGMFFGSQVINPSVMFRRSPGDDWLVYDSSMDSAEDYHLWLKIIPEMRFHNLQEPLIKYRRHSNNVSVLHKHAQLDISLVLSRNAISGLLGEDVPLGVVMALKNYEKEYLETDLLEAAEVVGKLYAKFIQEIPLTNDLRAKIQSDAFQRINRLSKKAASNRIKTVIIARAFKIDPKRTTLTINEYGKTINLAEKDLMMKKISVIIPVYNTAKYLRECLDSVLGQSFQDFEVICVNDGSTDDSRRILGVYAQADQRMAIIDQAHLGPSAARNTALSAAVGDYICFLDSDDRLDRTALERLYRHAREGDLDIVFFNGSTFFENKKMERKHPRFKGYLHRDFDCPGIMEGRRMFVCMVYSRAYKPSVVLQFYKSEFLKNNQLAFFNGILHEDNLFSFLSILQAARVQYIPDVLYQRRIRSGSIMTHPACAQNLRGYFLSFIQMLMFFQNHQWDGDVEAAIIDYQQGFHTLVTRIWVQISKTEQKKFFASIDDHERFLFVLLIKSNFLRGMVNRQLIKRELELERIKQSESFRIGKMITWLPKQVKKLLRQ